MQFRNYPIVSLVGGIPYDGSRVPIERHVSTEVTVVLSILATGGIAFSVVCLFFNFAFRNRKYDIVCLELLATIFASCLPVIL